MSFAERVLQERDWIPVPDEGWEVEAASPENRSVVFLNGTWEFAVARRDRSEGWRSIDGTSHWRWNWADRALIRSAPPTRDALGAGFYRFERPEAGVEWTTMPVPANWETHAASRHVFAHCSLNKDDVVGYYRRQFAVPEDWLRSGRIILQAEGIAASAEVYINETYCGYHDGGFIPFQLDVSDAVGVGENLIAVRVVKADISTVHDNSGQWMLSGIWRDVFLFHVPDIHIRDLSLETDYDAAEGRASARVAVRIGGGLENRSSAEVRCRVYPRGEVRPVAEARGELVLPVPGRFEVVIESTSLEPWHPEKPVVYRVESELWVDGRLWETVGEEVGFRRISAEGTRFLLNDAPFQIRGVTRHEIKQGRGRALSTADMIAELELMREAGITGVRSHPYPFDPRFIKLCARYGVLVCSGFCLCGYNTWGNPWSMSEVPTYPAHEADIDQGYRFLFNDRYHYFAPVLYARLKNMTAVFAWSLSNESAISEIFLPVARFLSEQERRLEFGRFIISAGDVNQAGGQFETKHPQLTPLIQRVRFEYITADSEHYPERRSVGALESSVPAFPDHPRPMFYTEYAHPFCNRDNFLLDPGMMGDFYAGAFARTFDVVKAMPAVGGVFVFEWSDQSVMQKGDPALSDTFMKPWHGYATFVQNIKGVVGPNHEPKAGYHAVRKAFFPIVVNEVRVLSGASQGTRVVISIRNEWTVRDTAEVRFRLTAWKAGRPVDEGRTFTLPCPAGATVRSTQEDIDTGSDADWIDIELLDPQRRRPVLLTRHRMRAAHIDVGPALHVEPIAEAATFALVATSPSSNRRVPVLETPELSLGVAGPIGAQRYLGMGYVTEGAYPDGVFGPEDLTPIESPTQTPGAGPVSGGADGSWGATRSWGATAAHRVRGNAGILRSSLGISHDDEALMVHQEIAFEGEPVWVPGLGLRFVLPRAYDRCAWTRRGGVLSDYPNDHPDRMTGRTRLDEDEYPPINPFRAPSSSALLVVRNAGVVVLYSERYPALRLEARADGQRCVVKTRADGSREVHLLIDAYCRPPYQEFSYLRADDAARELCGLRPVEGSIAHTWRLSVHPDARF